MGRCLGRKGAVGTEHSLKWAGQRIKEGLGVLRTTPSKFPNALRLVPHTSSGCGWASAVPEDFLRDFSPQTKVLRTWLKIPPVVALQ